jgi:hypothetical protein
MTEQKVFEQCSALVFVLDAQDEPYQVLNHHSLTPHGLTSLR